MRYCHGLAAVLVLSPMSWFGDTAANVRSSPYSPGTRSRLLRLQVPDAPYASGHRQDSSGDGRVGEDGDIALEGTPALKALAAFS